mgnify:CR=1 FL=1
MLNLFSLIIGGIALILAAIAFFPLVGWANWFIIPLAIIGAGIGAISSSKSGRNLNLFVILVGIVRLSIGGGILLSSPSGQPCRRLPRRNPRWCRCMPDCLR